MNNVTNKTRLAEKQNEKLEKYSGMKEDKKEKIW